MKDYYKIGEISKIYGIGRDSLMYYEEIGILKPFRDTNGYRMYNISDIWKLNLIKEFRSLNFPMKKIKEYLDDRSIESTKTILNEELDLIDKKMLELVSHKENIITRLSSIESVIQNTKIDEIEVVYIEKRKALELNADIERDEDFDFLIQKLQKEYEDRFNILGNNNIGSAFSIEAINNGIFNEFKSVFCFLEDNEEIYNIVFDEGYYVTLNYTGSNSNNKIYMEKVFRFIEENNYKINAAPIEIYKIDIHETGIVDEFVTEIQVPITK
ncbi:MerR family transcriptional regulator [Clostridioides sp. ZZV14-6154]|uniref:MerR family transcriptional regulator n=1 Tax=unclassified Clostridioides TaxID=2635829 RepID=UPI001D10FA03|nr:MerR family transcriptional regulator [Clostridioides sp. ZZV15-6388]MCC0659575.1 MerR family transcriptional regulator [Clostridioides sp. ZZV14-6154]MCC0663738.1 MerR family transcriptional regulator [Clostridioides sp. ZZV15-6597]MCC0666914.1 MerR family transcriptional regulator [Clostridioides sp. ZZV14-6153]MCC0725783.1 MerR family transcriptional regulator [Clostridioides sp. ZZV14-6045]MCC0729375.1 MerR family transcriptional regulator [Clostridioides sp. ZZV14-6048]MCC0733875.1 Me